MSYYSVILWCETMLYKWNWNHTLELLPINVWKNKKKNLKRLGMLKTKMSIRTILRGEKTERFYDRILSESIEEQQSFLLNYTMFLLMFPNMLPWNRSFQDLSYCILYFFVAPNFIYYDKLIVIYFQKPELRSQYKPKPKFWPVFAPIFPPIRLKSFDVLRCWGLKLDFNELFY